MTNKNLRLVFTLSIIANVLLAGTVAGMILDRPHDMPWDKVKEGLSPESQKLVSKMFQDTWKESSSVMRQSMDNRKYLQDVVAADEFDEKKFDEAVKRIRGVQDLMGQKKTKSTKELLAKLPKEDRQKLAESVANSFSWKGGRGKGHNYPQPPKPENKE